jgi:esterase/lipase superfamily enzyme
MHPDLVRQLRDEDVQRALIASGALDALVGRASRRQLRGAIERFRSAYGFAGNKGPLTEPEKAKLRDLYDDVRDWAGLKKRDCADPDSSARMTFFLPEKQVGPELQGNVAGKCDSRWSAYVEKDWLLTISPQIYSLYDNTPISLFRSSIMPYPTVYSQLHLTSDEFTTKGDVDNDLGGYVSYNLAYAVGDQVKALFMTYSKRQPETFKVPEFLQPLVEAETKPGDETQPDANTKGWQLLMRGITNLIASDFPFDNGWTKVSSKECTLTQDMDEDQPVRILFATDRIMKATAPRLGDSRKSIDPDSLFGTEQDRRLRMGCAYVSPPTDGVDPVKEASKPIVDYHLFHEGKEGDFADRLYLADEIAPLRTSEGQWTRGDALVFIHGYRVAFKDALYTVAKIVKDINFQGRAYLYSWPSRESLTGYFEDLENSEQAEPFFQSFMRMLMRDAHIYEIDLIAHSMGSQSMLRALAALRPIFDTERAGVDGRKWRGKVTSSIRIGQMIFAAPDVARTVFGQKIGRISPYADRVTVYVSSGDLALSTSKVIRGGPPRMGELSGNGEPALIDNRKVHIIDATLKQSWYQRYFGGGYGHDYLSQAKPVLDDIKDILTGKRADDTQFPHERDAVRFQKRTYTGKQDSFYWKLVEPK